MAPILGKSPTSLVGSVFERPTAPKPFKPFNSESGSTGFPTAKRRNLNGKSVDTKSAFMRSRQEGSTANSNTERPTDVPLVAPTGKRKLSDEEDWREQISRQNEMKVESMSPEEIEQERREIFERFGANVGDVLKKAKEARMRQVLKEVISPDDLNDVPVTSPTSEERTLRDSPTRPTRPIRPSLSTNTTRPSSPTKSSRKIRFQELNPKDIHVYESAPPSPKKKTFLALPPPPPADDPSRKDIVNLGDAKATIPPPPATDEPEEGTPEYIRRRYFPSAPTQNPDLAWMMESAPSTSSTSSALRFDLTGKPVSPSVSSTLPTHLGLHHHAEGSHAGYTLDDIFLLARSQVGAQRAAMLGVLKGVVRVLKEGAEGTADIDVKYLLDELKQKAPDLLKQILFIGLEALPERGSVGARAVEVVGECVEVDGMRLIPAIPLSDVLPQMTKVMVSPPDFSPDLHQTASQNTLLSILHRLAEFNADEIARTKGLIAAVIDVFVFAKGTEAGTLSPAAPSALSFLLTLIQTSRTSALNLLDLGLSTTLLRIIVLSQTETSSALNLTLDLYISLGKYGLCSHSAREVWRRLDPKVTPKWIDLMETWIVCATDPHKTTPSHDILWSHVSAWGWGDDLLSVGGCEVWHALAAWLEGSKVNGIKGGEREREDVVRALRGGFESGAEGAKVHELVDAIQTQAASENVDLAALATKAHLLTGAIRLWLASLPPTGPASSPPFLLPFGRIGDVAAILVRCNALWDQKQSRRPLSALLFYYLRLSKKLPSTTQDLWMAQAFSILMRMGRGEEGYAREIVESLVDLVTPAWIAKNKNLAIAAWEENGVGVLRGILTASVDRWDSPDASDDKDHMDEGEDKAKEEPPIIIAPLYPTPKSIAESTTQCIPSQTPLRAGEIPRGLPLRRDWILSPIDHLLKSSSPYSIARKMKFDASEVDIVRATLLFARIEQEVFKSTFKSDGEMVRVAGLTWEEGVFGCMKVFMLEHGLENAEGGGEEVFRDRTVSRLMEDLLHNTHRSQDPSETLEDVSKPFLGEGTPFYQFYTDFVALYDAISFAHPFFAQLLLPPLSMRYPLDYRKLFWSDFGHLVKTIRTPIFANVEEYIWPTESNPEVLSAYLQALLRNGDAIQGLLRLVAVHHVASRIWESEEEMLLKAVVEQGSVGVARDVVTYRQMRKEEGVLAPPECFARKLEEGERKRRVEIAERCGVGERLGKLFEEL